MSATKHLYWTLEFRMVPETKVIPAKLAKKAQHCPSVHYICIAWRHLSTHLVRLHASNSVVGGRVAPSDDTKAVSNQ